MRDFWEELEAHDRTHLVILAPHPDDEVFALGGTMRLAGERDLRVTVLAVTDGEASHARSTRITPAALVERRLDEVRRAYAALDVRPDRIRLGLPDGRVCAERLGALLPGLLTDSVALCAPLPTDGHPDHDACGRAAREVAARMDLPCFSFPIWAYHRAQGQMPEEGRSWPVALPGKVLTAKWVAMACFESQFVALGPTPEDGPVLPPGFAAPFERPVEVLYR